MTLQQFLRSLTPEMKAILSDRLQVSVQQLDNLAAGRNRVGPERALHYARILNMPIENVSPHVDWAAFRQYFELNPPQNMLTLETPHDQ